jgi:hypothetical protein
MAVEAVRQAQVLAHQLVFQLGIVGQLARRMEGVLVRAAARAALGTASTDPATAKAVSACIGFRSLQLRFWSGDGPRRSQKRRKSPR